MILRISGTIRGSVLEEVDLKVEFDDKELLRLLEEAQKKMVPRWEDK